MLTAVIIDDEQHALEVLQLQLAQYCKEVTVLATCAGGEKGIAAIQKFNPGLVFLDIEMPHVNGFDVLKATSQFNFDVIFTTAYDQFAIQAFKYSALDYLLKPIDITELQAAVRKAAKKQDRLPLDEKLQLLFRQLKTEPGRKERIAIHVGDALQFFDAHEIVRCESESNYTHLFLTSGKKITVARTLKDVEESLGGDPFCRVHQSHLININHVSKVMKGEGAYIVMRDGVQVAISRNRKDAFLDSFRKI